MKLSDAIRLGAMMKPQAFEEYFDQGHTCAIGAALDACGVDLQKPFCEADHFPILRLPISTCIACEKPMASCGTPSDLALAIYHLNDEHEWTREAIADWVQTIEQQQESAKLIETPEPSAVSR